MRTRRLLAAGAAWAAIAGSILTGGPALAAPGDITLSTPYPAVVVDRGRTTTFDIVVNGPDGQRVDLRVTDAPEGFPTKLRGSGFVIDAVTADRDEPPLVQLEVEVPEDAAPGNYPVTVEASSPGASDTLSLDLRVERTEAGGAELTSDFPQLTGPSDATYGFDLTLTNEGAQTTNFSLEGIGPDGWLVDVRPAGQAQASTLELEGGASGSITADVDPPDDAAAGAYEVAVRAVGDGQEAVATLLVEITGNFAIALSTPDERLNATVEAGRATRVPMIVFNDGTAPLLNVELSSFPPSDWEVTFEPEIIDVVEPGGQADVVAVITPSEQAVSGDYIVQLTASVAEASSEVDLRTTVKTSTLWGLVGILLIVAAVGGLLYVFRRFGRR